MIDRFHMFSPFAVPLGRFPGLDEGTRRMQASLTAAGVWLLTAVDNVESDEAEMSCGYIFQVTDLILLQI